MGKGGRLAGQINAFDRALGHRMSVGDRDTLAETWQELRSAGVLSRVLRPGDAAPPFHLPDQNGAMVELKDRLRLGPVVLLFIRGGWCPFCTLTLRAWQGALPLLHDAGGDLLAVSPQGHTQCCETAERDLLAYPVLSDKGGVVAKGYGVTAELPQRARALYLRFGHDLPRMNGDKSWRLTLPTTFILDPNGRIVLVDGDVLPQHRLEPDAAIAMVRTLLD